MIFADFLAVVLPMIAIFVDIGGHGCSLGRDRFDLDGRTLYLSAVEEDSAQTPQDALTDFLTATGWK